MATTYNNNIQTLSDFAGLINSVDEWDIEFNDIIEARGWKDLTNTEYGICSDGTDTLEYNEEGAAFIR